MWKTILFYYEKRQKKKFLLYCQSMEFIETWFADPLSMGARRAVWYDFGHFLLVVRVRVLPDTLDAESFDTSALQ